MATATLEGHVTPTLVKIHLGSNATKSDDTVPPKQLVLKSPMGAESVTYTWPLKKGKGSLRRSEDKHDEAAEIAETIRWVCEDMPAVREALDTAGIHYASYDPKSFDSMFALCDTYNKAVEKIVSAERGTPLSSARRGRVSRPHLKHILQKCYNKSVTDPNELNHYEAFTPEVYGETSFELICQMLDQLHPISPENTFIDLGSGVGQVVLQVAALTNCKLCLGIEKANTPAKYARDMEKYFRFWMDFYGKVYSDFRISHGDFLDSEHRQDILGCTIVFVNNFAFGPEVDQRLKDIFADLLDGARIFSSKSFCALNFRITDRNLSDIGTIMHVSKMDPLKGSVSWTGKPVCYYLHVIDRAKLERYFQKSAARNKGEKDEDGAKKGRRKNRINNNSKDGSSSGMIDGDTSSGSRDSRSSSMEKDDEFIPGTTTRRAWNHIISSDSVDMRKRRGRKGQRKNLSSLQASSAEDMSNMSTMSTIDETPLSTPTGSNASTPPPPEGRPVRAAVVNAAAITEAQLGDLEESPPLPPTAASGVLSGLGKKKGGRPKKGIEKGIKKRVHVPKINGLDLLHRTTLHSITESNNDDRAPLGCINERLNHISGSLLIHEELPVSLNTGDDGKEIPYQLQVHLDMIKKQYLTFMENMQSSRFKKTVEEEMQEEKKKRQELHKREKQLKAQIENLISDSLGLLKLRLSELGIQAKTPPEFIEKAKGIVCNHHDLQRNKANLEVEIRQLEVDQEKLVLAKEKELIQRLLQSGASASEVKKIVQREIDQTLDTDAKVAPLLNKLSDVTFTKCPTAAAAGLSASPEKLSTIRKRPSTVKQKDWPEKRLKAATPNDWPEVGAMAKIDEKNPEALARKIIEQGRSIEKKMVSPPSGRPTATVEVRKLEMPSPPARGYDQRSLPPTPPKARRTPTPSRPDLDQLALPPHPDSRSRSSEAGDDLTCYSKSKVSTTPRAEQFEDRLKTIIHSVLANDGDKAHQQSPQPPPMFSPTKKDLPARLPLPPDMSSARSTPMSSTMSSAMTSVMTSGMPSSGIMTSSSASFEPKKTQASTLTMNDLIASEIEKSLGSHGRMPTEQRSSRAPSTGSSNGSGGMIRINQVVEDSIRSQMGGGPVRSERADEGLLCPRRKSPESTTGPPPVHQRTNQYPQMEGLAARFMSSGAPVFDRRPPEQRFPPDRYDRGPMTAQAYHDMRGMMMEGRKRGSPPPPSPILPPKKQHLDEHPDYRQQPRDLSSSGPASSTSKLPPSSSSYTALPKMNLPQFTSTPNSGAWYHNPRAPPPPPMPRLPPPHNAGAGMYQRQPSYAPPSYHHQPRY